jgi:hypothetical protein
MYRIATKYKLILTVKKTNGIQLIISKILPNIPIFLLLTFLENLLPIGFSKAFKSVTGRIIKAVSSVDTPIVDCKNKGSNKAPLVNAKNAILK